MKFQTKNELFDQYEELSNRGAIRTCRTSGSSGNPLLIAFNAKDLDIITKIGARCFQVAGVLPSDRVVNCLNSQLWCGGTVDTNSFERLGANTFNFSVGNTRGLIEIILQAKITVLSCTPSYIDRIAEVCRKEFGIEPYELPIRLIVAGGEAGSDNPDFRDRIEKEWGCSLVNGNYGQADAVSVIASESLTNKGELIFLGGEECTAQILTSEGQLLDPKPGIEGELILTTHWDGGLIKRTNYKSGDLIRVNSIKSKYFSPAFTFNVIGRADDMLVIKGLNVYPSTVLNCCKKISKGVGNFQIHVSKDSMINECEIWTDNSDVDFNELRVALKKEVNVNFEILLKVPVVGSTGKIKQVIRDL